MVKDAERFQLTSETTKILLYKTHSKAVSIAATKFNPLHANFGHKIKLHIITSRRKFVCDKIWKIEKAGVFK